MSEDPSNNSGGKIKDVLLYEFENIGDTYVSGNPKDKHYKFEKTINGEILIRQGERWSPDEPFVTHTFAFRRIVSKMSKDVLIETHANRSAHSQHLLFSFSIKARGILVFLRADHLYLQILDKDNIDEDIWKVLEELYPPNVLQIPRS